MRLRLLALLVPAALVVGACSSTAGAPVWTYPPSTPAASAVAAAPEPTASAAAERTPAASIDHEAHHVLPSASPTVSVSDGEIAVVMTDAMRFEPGVITIAAGDEVTFVVQNAGVIPHEFFVGSNDEQEHHAEEMASDDAHSHDDALRLEAGETGRMTMSFPEPATLLIGCHEPGHYDAGMVGTLRVQ